MVLGKYMIIRYLDPLGLILPPNASLQKLQQKDLASICAFGVETFLGVFEHPKAPGLLLKNVNKVTIMGIGFT